MFDFLSGYSRIIVSGPQRSGTTICSRMISADLGLAYYDEATFRVDDARRFANILKEHDNLVIQAPGMVHWLTHLASSKAVAVVFMYRPIDQIISSEKRIGWQRYEESELAKLGADYSSPISVSKYRYWENVVEPVLASPFRIEYESLSSHPMFVEKENRAGFKPRQWRI